MLEVTEREIASPEEVGSFDPASVEWLDVRSGFEVDKQPRPAFDQAAESFRGVLTQQSAQIVSDLVARRLVSQQHAPHIVAQAQQIKRSEKNARRRKRVSQSSPAGQTSPSWAAPHWNDTSTSHQLNLEDLYTTMDFVPIERNIRLELYERDIFQENHISGLILTRLANAVTHRGWDFVKYKEELKDSLSSDNEDVAEIEALGEWFDNVNSIHDIREIFEHLAAFFQATSNAWCEVIREALGDPTQKPAGLDWAISSTMRVIKGHRGYIQWLAGQFRWFNVYMPRLEDRLAGVALWEEYWKERGIDTNSEEFLGSYWSRTLSSSMPEGTWNPHLTEMFHIKDISLSSKYYGFPKDYRLGKLHALLQYSVDYNLSLQRNNRIPPFLILFHGKMDANDRKDITDYFGSLAGAENWGRVPVIQAPAGGGGPQGGAPRAGLEIVKVAGEDKDGMFLQLWERIIKDIAMHYGIPYDRLSTDSSNRATVVEADEQWDQDTIGRLHHLLEERFKKITRYDLGFVNRYLQFVDLDTDDMMDKANEAQAWHDQGALSPNEVRERYLGLAKRPGGDQYADVGIVIEDEVGEETSADQAKQLMRSPTKLKAAEGAADATAAGQQAGDSSDIQSPGVMQSDLWEYLLAKYA